MQQAVDRKQHSPDIATFELLPARRQEPPSSSSDRLAAPYMNRAGPAGQRVAPSEWLALALGLALVSRYAWHLDDAFIYFRYVDNWVLLGRGLVFNDREWVEGFTSPLWILTLAVVRATTSLDYWTITRVVGVLSFTLYWSQLVALRRATAPVGAPVVNVPLALTCALYPVATYFTSGTESPLVLVAAAATARFALADRGRALPSIATGLAPLVRPELLLASVVLIGAVWARTKRAPRLALGVLVFANSTWLALRVWLYADLFPNTYHLKDGAHWSWGLAYLHDALLPYGGYALIALGPAAFAYARLCATPPRGTGRLALLAAAAAVALYVVRVGGDARHFRYLLFSWVLALTAMSGVAECCLAPQRSHLGVATSALILAATSVLHPRQLDRHPLLPGVQEERVGVVRDAQFHRAQPELTGALFGDGAEFERIAPAMVSALWFGRVAAPDGSSTMRAESIRARTASYLSPVRTHWWCAACWRWFTVRWVHDDGLTDAFLAHTDAEPWRPGHFGEDQHGRAVDLARVRERHGWSEAGALRRAVDAGDAPPWIVRNIDAMELIERKVQGHGDFCERLQLALTPIPTIEVRVGLQH